MQNHFRVNAPTTCLAMILLAAWSVVWPGAAFSATMSVQVKSAEIRSMPSFLGKIVGTANYTDPVTVVSSKGDWMQVTAGPVNGWVHSSALTKKKLKLEAGTGDANVAATGGELALAGKGFNKQVENQFRQKNPNLSFEWVDRMERMRVSPGEIDKFLKDGQLAAQGGAQ